MIAVLVLMTLGIVIGWFLHHKEKFLLFTGRLTNWAIYILLFLLGVSVGTNEKILNNFDKIGLQAILITLFAIAGSVLVSWLTYHFFFKQDER
ncbi:MAG TPA: LysO family transporter [Bacteroidales bacterium]|nr:LysO family transporter [Bacteroidales bacterium]